jgi:rhamnose transport system permease protein
MGGEWVTDLPRGQRALGTGAVIGIPLSVWAAGLVAAGALVLARRTRLGLRIYSVGDNPAAAAMSGVSIPRIKLFTFTLTGVLTGLAVLLDVPRVSVIEAKMGVGFELVVVTAVVVGGTAIRGGIGGIIGTVLAALLLGSIRSALLFLDLGAAATYWERAIPGVLILVAVLADHLRGAGARPGRRAAA